MTIAPTYPGVYIEEIPSGVRTITGVATSIAAFVGWAAKGPIDEAKRVLSFADFERAFGGLDARSLMTYAVHQFFANGGTQAYVVRLVGNDATTASVTLDAVLQITAKNPGAWAQQYAVAIKQRADDATRFRLAVVFVKPDNTEVALEAFENLSMASTDRRSVEKVINNESALVNVAVIAGASTPPGNTPAASPRLNSGTDGLDGTVLVPDASAFDTALSLTSNTGGVNLLDRVDLFNLLCVPGETNPAVISQLQQFCRARRAFVIADCAETATFNTLQNGPNNAETGDDAISGAFYFPWVNAPDPLQENRPRPFPPCGFVAGLYAKTDVNRGVWKAPAGTEASLTGVTGPAVTITDNENGVLNVQAVNCIRNFHIYGTIIWGARTMQGNDERGSEWKYIPVRRTALFIEETLYRNTQWVVFEPNDEPLWAQVRLNIGAFMHDLFVKGAFQGKTPRDAYFVKCDKESTTQNDINKGIVNIVVGFAPLKPAEFVIIKIQQIAGQIQT